MMPTQTVTTALTGFHLQSSFMKQLPHIMHHQPENRTVAAFPSQQQPLPANCHSSSLQGLPEKASNMRKHGRMVGSACMTKAM